MSYPSHTLHKSARLSTRLYEWSSATPGRLKLAFGIGCVLTTLLCVVVLYCWEQSWQAVKTLGVDAAPSVVAAHKISTQVETLDADLVNELLGKPGSMAEYVRDFDRNRIEIGRQLIVASKNITYGDAELEPIQRIQDGLGRYLMMVQVARDAHTRGDQAAMLGAYRNSYTTLKKTLIPAAKDLNAVNDRILQSTYIAQQKSSQFLISLVGICGGGLVLFLIGVQIYLSRRFRRRFNPALALATLLSILFTTYTIYHFTAHANDLKGLKEDSYNSVAALLDTHADVYEANAAESRWLLDIQSRAEHDRTFKEFNSKLVTFKNGYTFDLAYETARRRNILMAARIKNGDDPVTVGQIARTQFPLDNMSGSLKKALDNITFVNEDLLKDEPTQSAETLRTYGIYLGLDSRIRQLELSGNHDEAVRFCLSMKEGESNWAFFNFDKSLGNWINLNEYWMHRYKDAAFADISGLNYAAPILCVLIIALIFFGLRPRIREYSI